ncbi:MAG: hypothetical protein EOR68_17385 [Mesorhizobium sp.]|nr:MAG: hypothetical protein EOR68_17385 [Mesorhizobium sp.]TIP41405.1 MAG: hypothetical protein E5X77_26080 [Mesorhizobium sp.]
MVAHTLEVSRDFPLIVILWRSKERSDAAQTIESIPLPMSVATGQNLLRCTLRSRPRNGSSGLRVRFAPPPVDDEVRRTSANRQPLVR